MSAVIREAKNIRDADESSAALRAHKCDRCVRTAYELIEDVLGHSLNVAVDIHCTCAHDQPAPATAAKTGRKVVFDRLVLLGLLLVVLAFCIKDIFFR